VKHTNLKRDLKIRPLSEGIGLGTLKSTTSPSQGSFARPSLKNSPQDVVALRRAQAAYQPHSVATQMRSRTSTVWFVRVMRFIAGVGLDLFVGSFTLLVFAWAGILAWNLGAKGELNPFVSLLTITDTLERLSLAKLFVALVTAAIFWRASRLAFLKPRVA
jgi:hypothetical protein